MYRLAGELAQAGARVLVTTTTRILPPAPPLVAEALTHAQGADCRQTLSALDLALSRHSPVALTAPGKDGKAAPLPPHLFAALPESADYVLVEADGSRGLPLKAPASHEPVIPPESDLVIAVAGLSALAALGFCLPPVGTGLRPSGSFSGTAGRLTKALPAAAASSRFS